MMTVIGLVKADLTDLSNFVDIPSKPKLDFEGNLSIMSDTSKSDTHLNWNLKLHGFFRYFL